ncbi:MAG: hypothetical protein AAFV90_13680 [Cyanobacteria bacterium J06634_5]
MALTDSFNWQTALRDRSSTNAALCYYVASQRVGCKGTKKYSFLKVLKARWFGLRIISEVSVCFYTIAATLFFGSGLSFTA